MQLSHSELVVELALVLRVSLFLFPIAWLFVVSLLGRFHNSQYQMKEDMYDETDTRAVIDYANRFWKSVICADINSMWFGFTCIFCAVVPIYHIIFWIYFLFWLKF